MKLGNCILVFLMTLVACESPMNHRTLEGGVRGKSRIETSLFADLNIEAEAKWIDGPYGNIKKPNYLIVFLYKDGRLHSLPEDQTLEFYATMPSMGHPMEDAGFFEEVEPGIYVNKAIRYNMPGSWKNELWIMDKALNIMDEIEWHEFF